MIIYVGGWRMDEVKLLKYSQTIDSIISGHEPAVLYMTYLVLTECTVLTVSYGPSFFPRLIAQA